jgi:hypothetical protein
MDTLVIHPSDRTTHFLSSVYVGLGYTVCTDPEVPDSQLTELIQSHQRIVVLGHGSAQGLFHPTRMTPHLIGAPHVPFLRAKECILIWCYAADFARQHQLKAFCSGMFISEPAECLWVGVRGGKHMIQQSNTFFAAALRTALQSNSNQFNHEKLLELYPSDLNRIAEYNAPQLAWMTPTNHT